MAVCGVPENTTWMFGESSRRVVEGPPVLVRVFHVTRKNSFLTTLLAIDLQNEVRVSREVEHHGVAGLYSVVIGEFSKA